MTDELENKPADKAPSDKAPAETSDTKPTFKQVADKQAEKALPKEIGGTDGPEPTRFGDWEHKGIASDF